LKYRSQLSRMGAAWTLLYIPLILLFALTAAASVLPDRRLWGINHLAFYSPALRIVALSLIGLSFVPVIARASCGALSTLARHIRPGRRRLWWSALALGVMATGIFIRFQSSTLLLGDGWATANSYEHAILQDTGALSGNIEQVVTDEPFARGTTVLYYRFAEVLNRVFDVSPVRGIRILNCLLGGLLVFILARIALRSTDSPNFRIWLLLLVLCSGVMELFFGYVENYTPAVFFALLYLASGYAFIRGRKPVWLAASLVCLATSTYMHVQGTLLIPSFALLAGWAVLAGRWRRALGWLTGALGALVVVGTCVIWAFSKYGSYLLPLRADDGSYGVFAASHWADVINEVLILLPGLPVFIAIAAMLPFFRERARPGDRRVNLGQLGVEWSFTVLLLLPGLMFLILFKPDLGMARDWDLFAMTFIGLLAFALFILKRFLAITPARVVQAITVPSLVISAVLGASWIGVNSSSSRATDRYEQILTYDETFAQYAYENLAQHYYSQNDLDKAIAMLEKGVSFSYNRRLYTLLSIYYDEDHRMADAIRVLRTVLERDPHLDAIRHDMVNLLSRAGEYDELLTVARDGTLYHPENPTYHYVYGWLLVRKGQAREGAEELLEARRLNPPRRTLEQIDGMLRQLEAEGKL